MFPPFELSATGLTQKFNNRRVWRDIALCVRNGDVLGITGRNGAGKTTLLRILTGLLTPTSGTITCAVDGVKIELEYIVRYVGFVAPYLTLYEEFTPLELVRLLSEMRGDAFTPARTEELLQHFRIFERRNEAIQGFSSGMKQRCKYICALQHRPPLLILDEPMTNLDAAGIEAVEAVIKEHQRLGGVLLLATNDARDLALCTATLNVSDFVS